MKKMMKRIVSMALCICMLAGLFVGISLSGDEKEKVLAGDGNEFIAGGNDSELEKIKKIQKNTEYDVGTSENPFVVLEIVPSIDQAYFGYYIPGCEPIDLNIIANDYNNYGGSFEAAVGQAYTVDKSSGTHYDFIENIIGSQYPIRELGLPEIYKNLENATYETTGSSEKNCWRYAENQNTVTGFFEKVTEGTGNFTKFTEGGTWGSVSAKDSNGNTLYFTYTGVGDYNWVESNETPESEWDNSDPETKIWTTRADSFQCDFSGVQITNNDELLKNVFGEGVSSKQFVSKVVSVTPEMLVSEDYYRLIDIVDLIFIHTSLANQDALSKLWLKAHVNADGTVGSTNVNRDMNFANHDITNEAALRIVKRMASSNPTALIYQMPAIWDIDATYNLRKLLFMTLEYEPNYFCNKFLDQIEEDSKDRDKLYYTKATDQNGNPTGESGYNAWDMHTFRYDPYTGNDLINSMRFYNIGSGGKTVFDKIFTFNGDKSMLQDFFKEASESGEASIDYSYKVNDYTNHITSDMFEYFNELNGENSTADRDVQDAMHYILNGGYKLSDSTSKLRILEIQPCDEFIYDGTQGRNAKWKTYYRSLFPWYRPKSNVSNDPITDEAGNQIDRKDWMDDPKLLQIDTMTTYEFIGSVGYYDYNADDVLEASSSDDLTSKYDMIIIGSKQDATNGKNGYNDSNLGNLIYSSLGDLVWPTTPSSTSVLKTFETRYSGNDLTLKKILELEDFLRAGRAVVVDDALYTIKSDATSINTDKVDKSSKTYDFMNWSSGEADTVAARDRADANRFVYGQVAASQMRKALITERCVLRFYTTESYPKEYSYSTTETTVSSNSKSDTLPDVINQTNYANDNLYYNFMIEGSANKEYYVYLHFDLDGDGTYTGSLKQYSEIRNTNLAMGYAKEEDYTIDFSSNTVWSENSTLTNASALHFDTNEQPFALTVTDALGNKVTNGTLKANTMYTAIRRTSTSQQGVVPWKLEVHAADNPYQRSSAIDYTAVQNPDAKVKIRVLQMNLYPNMEQVTINGKKKKTFADPWGLDNSIGTAFTDKSVKVSGEYNPSTKYTEESTDLSARLQTLEEKGLTDNEIINAKKFEAYFEPVQEFDVKIQFLANQDWKTLFPTKSGMSKEEKARILNNWKDFLSQYDMLILGFQNSTCFTEDEVYVEGLKDFIDQGKSVIFSHDLVTDSGFATDENAWAKQMYTEYEPWLRTISGQRRAYYNYDSSNQTYKKSYESVQSNGTNVSLSNSAVKSDTYANHTLAAADGVSADTVGQQSNEYRDNSVALLLHSLKNGLDSTKYKYDRDITQIVKSANNYWDDDGKSGRNTTYVSIANNGQITCYPYKLPKVLEVQATHAQNYQLNLEPEVGGDVNVWFNLTDRFGEGQDILKYKKELEFNGQFSSDIYSQREQDSRNSFYIYNKGNITYTGSGHGKALNGSNYSWMTDDEVKLFVNTIISAYRRTEGAPDVIIENADTIGNDNVAVMYLDYDTDAGQAVDGRVDQTGETITSDSGYVTVKFRLEDLANCQENTKEYFLTLSQDGKQLAYGDIDIYDEDGNLVGSTTDKNGVVAYKVDAPNEETIYSMKVPYSELTDDGEVSFSFVAYAQYQKGGKTLMTEKNQTDLLITYLPLFKLD